MTAPVDPTQDPRRWITLGILITAVILIAVDTSVLNVSIPTILRDLHTTVPSLEWVITGYSLTFATLLVIGGRLGDIYGHRKLFIIGAALFGTGSLLASVSQSVGVLILGEAIIEGIGASADDAGHPGHPVHHVPGSRNAPPPSPSGAPRWARPWPSARCWAASSPPTTRGAGRSAST